MAQGDVVLSTAASPRAPSKGTPSAKIDPRGPTSAAVVVGGFLALTLASRPASLDSPLPWTLDPTGYLHGTWYVLLYFATIPAKELMNAFLGIAARSVFGFRRMDEGEGTVRKLEVLETIDLCFLALNTLVEFIGMNHIVAFLIAGPVETRLRTFGLLNGPVAFIAAMCLNDLIYYPFHLVAHKRTFYPYCHKQHHRQFVPFRGYADAANQHPFEQMYGFCIFIASLHFTSKSVGLHAATAWCAFLAWAVLNIANHLAFDSQIHLPLPYPAFPRDHQMHHRFPQCNYSTLTSFCDRAFGTFRPYKELGEPIARPEEKAWYEAKDPDKKERKESVDRRPEAIPSVYSVLALAVAMFLATVVLEVFHIGKLPDAYDFASLIHPALLFVNMAIVCLAAEPSSSKGPQKADASGNGVAEAVPEGHAKQFIGGKSVWKASLVPDKPKPFKRE